MQENQTKPNENPAPQTEQKVKRGEGAEAKRVAERLNGFNYETSETWRILKEKFSSGVTHSELKSVAFVLCQYAEGLALDRDATRDNRVLIKWFDEHWDIIKNLIDKVSLKDEKEVVINQERELKESKGNQK